MDGPWFELFACVAGVIIPLFVCTILKSIDLFKDIKLEREINNTPKLRKVSKKKI